MKNKTAVYGIAGYRVKNRFAANSVAVNSSAVNSVTKFGRAIIFSVLFLLLVFPLAAIDIGLYGGAGNIAFDTKSKSILGDAVLPKAFTPHLYPLAGAYVSGENGFVSYEGGFQMDPILRNRLYADIGIEMSFFSMKVGPFIGLMNTDEEFFNPGFTAALGFQLPGIFFINFEASSSFGPALETTGSYTQKTGGISAGFWVPYVICSLNMSSNSYAQRIDLNLLAEDSIDRYFFRADIFTKNVPFTIKVDIGYALLKRSYSSQVVTDGAVSGEYDIVTSKTSDQLKFIYAGLQAAYSINSMFKLYAGAEMPLYSWSVPDMKNPDKKALMFNASGGIIITL
ncbi:MAG: hypothetical protein FWD78_03915 [Treponema sp.]|nr:hypothetical protein [Treponema sp.]